jgi:hypothetical protein
MHQLYSQQWIGMVKAAVSGCTGSNCSLDCSKCLPNFSKACVLDASLHLGFLNVSMLSLWPVSEIWGCIDSRTIIVTVRRYSFVLLSAAVGTHWRKLKLKLLQLKGQA